MKGYGRIASIGRWAALLVLITIAVAAALWASAQTHALGFPLDDAWIHQTYARNLAQRGEWAFLPGMPTAGSTSPLWTALIAVGYGLHLDPKAWTYLLGAVLLAANGWLGGRWLAIRAGMERGWIGWAACLLALEWHLVWSAVSGMEILALTTLSLLVFLRLDVPPSKPWLTGALVGLGVWVRPGALSLFVPLAWHIVFRSQEGWRGQGKAWSSMAAGFLLLFLPYLLFNRALSGGWWPTTYYAKQAEYALMRSLPFLSRLAAQCMQPLVGVGTALLPGLLVVVVAAVRRRAWTRLAPLVWALAYLGIYALRLPVTYQHGRYAMPTIPVVLLLGMEGMHVWVRPRAPDFFRRVTSRAWPLVVVLVSLSFVVIGVNAYSLDVAIIETEMVAAARWIAGNTEGDALVASHDIGALGYYGERTILDLAGLVSPEVIPILRDEQALETFLDERGADYLMTFPGWYPQLALEGEPVYRTGAPFSPAAGGENMVVYRWVP